MNKMMKAVKGNGKVTPNGNRINLGTALSQKSQMKKHMTETSPTMGEFLAEAQAELENLFS